MTSTAQPSVKKQMDRRLLMSLHQDGLLDVLAGAIVGIFGLIPILDATGMSPLWRQVIYLSVYALIIVLVLLAKQRLILPRAGSVRLKSSKRKGMAMVLLALNMLVFFFFVMSYFFELRLWSHMENFRLSLSLGGVFLLMYSSAAWLLRAPRFALYSLLTFALFVWAEFLYFKGYTAHHGIPLAAFSSGGLMCLTGGYYLAVFLKKHPAHDS